ncbi:MAG: GNAT family N-acetyltransferase [Saprospiraceae bacterium]|uniref:GNAT family N-acetyltransferase n=1 Tax=Candidatus Defluviibacterium haderslevense TaxID=2981993 RepID=A0A9D7S7J1_9BACT|nr:GNAT family N-acetyltransferase [Candidatus Defluviibacterium haderslevense]MBL0237657.1 GNAT family N-acetyltransferase [Candidatus Defluviibacterium haderslevense]
MIHLIRTNNHHEDFKLLVIELDKELKLRDGDDHTFYAQYNKSDNIKYVLVAYNQELPIACGAIKEYDQDTMEIKRMFVRPNYRNQGLASLILKALKQWCLELHYTKCMLETGINQPEAIRLYEKNNYTKIPNYGPYINVENSFCFLKVLNG